MCRPVRMMKARASVKDRVSRVSCEVDGEEVWFESEDVELAAAPEAFGCAMLPAAFARHVPLASEMPIDGKWLANVRRLQEVWHRWWDEAPVDVSAPSCGDEAGPRAEGVALCFSGGVDSFFTLRRSNFEFDHLVFVHGFDIPLADLRRAVPAERALREVAHAVGARPVVIRTNVREHPAFAATNWERSHGGALAAIGHVLTGTVGTFVISSSYPYYYNRPWGSHWDTDPLWSSAKLEILHYGAEQWRTEKLIAIAEDDLVRKYLRVCWENQAPEGNCGRCEKCVRTMLVLAQVNQLERYRIFDGTEELRVRIDRVPRISSILFPIYDDFVANIADPEIVASVRSLLKRSRRKLSRIMAQARRLRRFLARLRRRLGAGLHARPRS